MITAQAIRFTDNVPAMRRFCELLGLAATVTASDSWAVMRSAGGEVLLHSHSGADTDVVQGQTNLTFEVTDAQAVAEAFGTHVLDESYGRSVTITDPDGQELLINEAQTDFYGYAEHEAHPADNMSVCPVVFADPSGPWKEFLEKLGLTASADADDAFASFTADRGSVGVHVARPGEYERFLTGHAGARAHLTFAFTGDAEALAAQLRQAGHEVRVDTSFGTMLEITDPDGQLVQVHAS